MAAIKASVRSRNGCDLPRSTEAVAAVAKIIGKKLVRSIFAREG